MAYNWIFQLICLLREWCLNGQLTIKFPWSLDSWQHLEKPSLTNHKPPHNKVGGDGGYIDVTLSVHPSHMSCPLCNAYWVLDGFFLYQAQVITSIRGCVTYNDLWPSPLSTRSFSDDFATKLLKSRRVRCTAHIVPNGFFPYLAQMIINLRGCITFIDPWSWCLSTRSFSHDFAIKLLKYGTSCRVHSTARTVLGGFFPYLVQMITSIMGCVMHNDLWTWPISSRSFSYEFAIKLLEYRKPYWPVCSTACTVMVGSFSYLAQMVTNRTGCVDR